jgi:hypothetical protein
VAAALSTEDGLRHRCGNFSPIRAGPKVPFHGSAGMAERVRASDISPAYRRYQRIDQPYKPRERCTRVKSECLNRAEFVVVGWHDPEGSRVLLGSLLLGYYTQDGRLIYAGRVGTGMSQDILRMLHGSSRF